MIPRPPSDQPTQGPRAELPSRRDFLGRLSLGLGGLSLASLLDDKALALAARPYQPRARRVIYIHLAGSPPQHDLFDFKPTLERFDRKPCPAHLLEGERFAFIKGHPKILASPYSFRQHGESGAWVSELLPNLAGIADKLCFVKSMHTDQFNHAPAQLMLQTGSPRIGRPAIGAWLSWGLGSENKDLPAFVVLNSGGKVPSAGKSVWGSGFLPSVHQGVQFRSHGDPVLYLRNPDGMDRAMRRRELDLLADLNRMAHERDRDPETLTRIEQFELSYRMQTSVPELCDLAREDPATLALYGAQPGKGSFANNCLLARRLVEAGVRFVQLYDWGWDNHGTSKSDDLMHQLPKKCRETDRPLAALVVDLERRGLLEDTLVVWGGEFGRTPLNEERNGSKFLGRDHHPHCFTMWLAGGGVKAGLSYGTTDDLGYHVADKSVHVHDLQATIFALLGIDHERLTYRFMGRDFRLTDIAGRVVHDLIA